MSAAKVEARELRLGICECTDAFGDRLNGREVQAGTYSLRVVQVPIGGVDHNPDIRVSRAHFFLDTNILGDTFLYLINLYPTRVQGLELVRKGLRSDQGIWWERTVPSAGEVVGGLAAILGRMDNTKLEQWLDKMTPAGWTLPARSLVLASPSCDINRPQAAFGARSV